MKKIQAVLGSRPRQKHLLIISRVRKGQVHPMKVVIRDPAFEPIRSVENNVMVAMVDLGKGKDKIGGVGADPPAVSQTGVDTYL